MTSGPDSDGGASRTAAEALLDRAEAASGTEDTLRLAGEALAAELLESMKSARIPKAEQSVSALSSVGLDRLLAEAIADGRVRFSRVDSEIERLRGSIVARDHSANDVKLGILAFDEIAQRLSMVAGKGGSFSYPHSGNRARDSLITFARSLHR